MVWTNNYLGSCENFPFNVNPKTLRYKVKSSDGNDFCPEWLTIHFNNTKFRSSEAMSHWADFGTNDRIMTASRFLGTFVLPLIDLHLIFEKLSLKNQVGLSGDQYGVSFLICISI